MVNAFMLRTYHGILLDTGSDNIAHLKVVGLTNLISRLHKC